VRVPRGSGYKIVPGQGGNERWCGCNRGGHIREKKEVVCAREKWYQPQAVLVLLSSATGGDLGYCTCVHNHFTTFGLLCKL
jgi:hypothetical protein